MVRDYELMMGLQVWSVVLFLVQHVKRGWQIMRIEVKHTQVRLCFYLFPLYHHIVITCSSMCSVVHFLAHLCARQLYDSFSVSWTDKCTFNL